MHSRTGHPALLMVWLPLLVGLQGVPHTGGLRTLFLLIGMGHLAWLKSRSHERLPDLGGRAERTIFLLLLAWLVMQTLFCATQPLIALHLLIDDWGKLILMLLVGIWASKLVPQGPWLASALFAGAFLHVLATLGAQVLSLFRGAGLAWQQSLMSEYPLAATFTTMSLAWLMADGVAHVSRLRRLFPWPAWVSAIGFALAYFAEMVLMVKSGQVMTIALTAIAASILLIRTALDRGGKTLFAAACVVVLGLLAVVSHDRWSKMEGSIDAAGKGPLPIQALVTDKIEIPQGADHSFYMRALRAKVALNGILENPLGIGFGADVYQRYVKSKYGIDNAIQSSNSGLIDFTLATGVPGALLLLLLAGALVRRGWLTFKEGRGEGLALVLLVVNQLGVYVLDGTLAGSRFNGFALIAGALWALSTMKGSINNQVA